MTTCIECNTAEGWAVILPIDPAGRVRGDAAPERITGRFLLRLRKDHPVPQYIDALEVSGHG